MVFTFKTFYSIFFKELVDQGLSYSVVRNYEGLPSSKPGGDVDILVEKKQIDNILFIINKILVQVKGRIEITSIHHYVIKLKLYNVVDDKSKESVTELDLITKLSWKGLSWLSESEVLGQSNKNNLAIYVPEPKHELQMSLFHSLLYGGFVKKRYYNQMSSLFLLSDKHELKEDLDSNFGKKIGQLIFDNIETSNWKGLEGSKRKLRQILIKKNMSKYFINTIFAIISHYYLEIIIRINSFIGAKSKIYK